MMKKVLIGILIFLAFLVFYVSTIHLTLSLNGEQKIEVPVFQEYDEQGAEGCYRDIFGFCLFKIDVKTVGHVDINRIGSYDITYEASSTWHQKKIERKVFVVDNIAPKISASDDQIATCPGNENINLKYTVFDNYDQDITNRAIERIEDKQFIIEVSDSSGNYSSLKIPITYDDNEKPVITLKGGSVVSLLKGEDYIEPGYLATDNCLGDITNRVKVTNNIDSRQNGKYQVIYTVSDDLGNTTTIQRTVYVYEKNPDVLIGDKVIYLTFDDGPSSYTGQLLDVLKKYNVKATFFVTGKGSDKFIKRAYDEGHSIGLHTYKHQYKEVYKSVDDYFSDLDKVSDRVKQITGIETKLIRFPGGSSNTVSKFNPGIMTVLSKEVELRGYKYFDWNISSGDTSTTSTDKIANNVIKSLRKGNNVVLQHDTKKYSVEAVSQIIEYGLANGYVFAPLDMTSPTVHHTIAN